MNGSAVTVGEHVGERRAGPLREILTGVGMLPRGMAFVTARPRMFALGAIPPAITSVLMIVIIVSLVLNVGDLVTTLTPFAAGWAIADGFRQVVQLALVLVILLVLVIAFSTLTLALGSPLYDKISEAVDAEAAAASSGREVAPTDEEPVAAGIGRAIRQSLALIAISALVAIPLFLAGFIPVVGQSVVPVISACFGGWMITIELVGSAFDRRGRRKLAQRRTAMRGRRLRCLGFGVPTFLLLSIPFVSVIVFPAATAGGTLLARSLLPIAPGESRTGSPGDRSPQ